MMTSTHTIQLLQKFRQRLLLALDLNRLTAGAAGAATANRLRRDWQNAAAESAGWKEEIPATFAGMPRLELVRQPWLRDWNKSHFLKAGLNVPWKRPEEGVKRVPSRWML